MPTDSFHIDWAGRWGAQVAAEHAQYQAVIPPERQQLDFWGPHAARFRAPRRVEENAPRDEFVEFVLARTAPGAQILDVGSGAGRYALPLARAGRRMIALDASESMITALRADAQTEGLEIATHVADWESAEIAPADTLICAHVLYAVGDGAAFVRKLDGCATRQVFILMGYEPPITWLGPFWRVVYGIERIRLPGAIEALALLHQQGIDATLTPLRKRLVIGYDSLDAALHSVRGWLHLEPEPERDARLLAELGRQLIPSGGGFVTSVAPRLAVLSWAKA